MNSINQASISVIFYHKLKIFHTVLTIKHRFKGIFFHVNSKNGLYSCTFSLVSGYLTMVLLSISINGKYNLHVLWKRYCFVCSPSLDLNICVLLTTECNTLLLKLWCLLLTETTWNLCVHGLVSLGHDYSHKCFITMTLHSF